MIRSGLGRLRARIADFWDLPEAAERIQGTGEVYLEPAYNGRYTAERRLADLANPDEAGEVDPGPIDPATADEPR